MTDPSITAEYLLCFKTELQGYIAISIPIKGASGELFKVQFYLGRMFCCPPARPVSSPSLSLSSSLSATFTVSLSLYKPPLLDPSLSLWPSSGVGLQ